MAPDSHRTMPVLGSSMAGVRPLGLMLMKGGFLTSSWATRRCGSWLVSVRHGGKIPVTKRENKVK